MIVVDSLREVLEILQDRIDNPNAHWGVTSDLKECWNIISSTIDELESQPSLPKEEPICNYCKDSGYDPYPNHDTTQRPCPECSPVITHINATPEFFDNKEAVEAMSKMVKLAAKSVSKPEPKTAEALSIPLNGDSPWNTIDVISRLVDAADILLHKKDYDGHDHEEIEMCYKRGKEIVSNFNTNQFK